MTNPRCTICRDDRVADIDADLADDSIRAVARRWLVSRSALTRHAQHAETAPTGMVSNEAQLSRNGTRDHVAAALAVLEAARNQRARLSALAGVRSALRLELRDHARARSGTLQPTDAQLAQLEAHVTDSWHEYETAATEDLRSRALAGVRSALDVLRTARARSGDEAVAINLTFFDIDDPAARIHHHGPDDPADGITRENVTFYGIPDTFADPPHHAIITLSFSGHPDVEVCDGSRIVWERRGSGLAEVEGNGRGR